MRWPRKSAKDRRAIAAFEARIGARGFSLVMSAERWEGSGVAFGGGGVRESRDAGARAYFEGVAAEDAAARGDDLGLGLVVFV